MSVSDDPRLRRLLWFLMGGSRGGDKRARIINHLSRRPSNLNQLSRELKLQYKLVQHHVGVLKKNSLLITSGEGYGEMYFLSPWFEAHLQVFRQVCEELKIRLDSPQDQSV
ncbi:MAG: winged helix-turn-helix domain-containing protein [Thaumarchaeota archaeon]|nr:winged helix-turn-helix domain-containing protein [Nitrososphaerota archaeon]